MNALDRYLGPMRRRISLMVGRGVLGVVDDTATMQSVQVGLLADETHDTVERFQNYGFTSKPHAGAEAAVIFVGGTRSHGLVVAVDDRRYRLTGLADGEVAVQDDLGQVVHLKRDRITVSSPAKIEVLAPEIDLTATTKVAIGAPEIDIAATTKLALSGPEIDVTASTKAAIGGPEIDLAATTSAAIGAPDVSITGGSTVAIEGGAVSIDGSAVALGGAGGSAVARVGDAVSPTAITAGSAKVTAA